MIKSYNFGNIIVDGKKYTSDLIIFPDKIIDNWVRKKGHELNPDDIEDIIQYNPDYLVIGKGAYGFMKISRKTKEILKSNDIELIALKTKKACKKFNEISEEKDVVGAFHITC